MKVAAASLVIGLLGALGYGIHAQPARAESHLAHNARRGSNDLRDYARTQAAHRGWTGAQWQAIDRIVTPESGWNPCRRFPSTTDCHYIGANSCGIPQANPCPLLWRGRLWETRWAQVRWLLDYIGRRYGDPISALAYRLRHGSY